MSSAGRTLALAGGATGATRGTGVAGPSGVAVAGT
jgi:hypothetical protein